MQQSTNGEEAVYSSDGLSQLSLPNAPMGLLEKALRVSQDTSNAVIKDEYDTSPTLDSRSAFEMFQGKLYIPTDESGILLRRQRHQSYDHETLLEKLARLNSELKELEADFPKIGTGSDTQRRDQDVDTKITEQMRDAIKDISSRLNALSAANGTLSRSKLKLQKDLTSSIKQDLSKLSSLPQKKSSASSISKSTSSSSSQNKVGTQPVSSPKSKLANEASQADPASVTITTDSADGNSFENVERRLRRLENFVGNSNMAGMQEAIGSSKGTLLQRLFDLEQKIHRIDDKALQVAATRAKVIRADLEAAAKARNKLNLAQSNTAEDSHVIARLYEQLLDLDGFFVSSPSNLLTSIVQRLSTCANLHSKAMSFENRLDGLERIVKDLTPTVQNLEDCISRVESGMINNMKVLEQNMNALDDQVKAIR